MLLVHLKGWEPQITFMVSHQPHVAGRYDTKIRIFLTRNKIPAICIAGILYT